MSETTLSASVPSGGQVRLLAVSSPVAGRGPFTAEFADLLFPGPTGEMTNHDPVTSVGYNQAVGGVPNVPGEPGLALGMEADYFDGVRRTMEFYLQYIDGSTTFAMRPFVISINRETHRVHHVEIHADHIVINGDDGSGSYAIPVLDIQKNNVVVRAGMPGAQTALHVETSPGQPSILSLTFGGQPGAIVGSDGPDRAFVQCGGAVPIRADEGGVAVTGLLLLERARATGLVPYADNAAALAGGLVAGDLYRLGDGVGIVH